MEAYTPDLYRYAFWLGNSRESAGRGSLAIIGERGEALEVIERRLKRALRFDSPKIARHAGGSHV